MPRITQNNKMFNHLVINSNNDVTIDENYYTTCYKSSSKEELRQYITKPYNYNPNYDQVQDIEQLWNADNSDLKTGKLYIRFEFFFQPDWKKHLRPMLGNGPRPAVLPPISEAFYLAEKFFNNPTIMHQAMYQVKTMNSVHIKARELLEVVTYPGKQIGEESGGVSGKVYLSGISNDQDHINYLNKLLSISQQSDAVDLANNLSTIIESSRACFAVKTVNIIEEEIIHECVIGMELNQMRNMHCPYFMYTYGLYDCGNITFLDHKVLSLCGNGEIAGYLFLENITDSITMGKAFADPSRQKYFASYLLCIAYALQKAFVTKGFIHGDLHDNNILLRNKDTLMRLPIEDTNGNIIYVESMGCPTIIDFGRAKTTKNNMTSDVLSDEYTPVHSFLRFMLSIIDKVNGNLDVFTVFNTFNLQYVFDNYHVPHSMVMTVPLGTFISSILWKHQDLIVDAPEHQNQKLVHVHNRELNLSDLLTHNNVTKKQRNATIKNENKIIELTNTIIIYLAASEQSAVVKSLMNYLKTDVTTRETMLSKVSVRPVPKTL